MGRWIAFYSRTGSELVNIGALCNRVPDIIVTNRTPGESLSDDITEMIRESQITLKILPKNPKVEDYMSLISCLELDRSDEITLHGYLRILPEVMCSLSIKNLHPGLITKYAELKGKDPQIRAWEENHRVIGCVIHEVVLEVDEGPIIAYDFTEAKDTLSETYDCLAQMAVNLWEPIIEKI